MRAQNIPSKARQNCTPVCHYHDTKIQPKLIRFPPIAFFVETSRSISANLIPIKSCARYLSHTTTTIVCFSHSAESGITLVFWFFLFALIPPKNFHRLWSSIRFQDAKWDERYFYLIKIVWGILAYCRTYRVGNDLVNLILVLHSWKPISFIPVASRFGHSQFTIHSRWRGTKRKSKLFSVRLILIPSEQWVR